MAKKTQVTKVTDKSAFDHFAMIPNLIDDIPMSLAAHRLYCHLKRVAGDAGKSWQSTHTLAEHCGVSYNTIVKAKKELRMLGFIDVRKVNSNHGGHPYDEIRIRWIWDRNHDTYTVDPNASGENRSGYDDYTGW